MFLLSEILKKMNFESACQIEDEKPFKYLALSASRLSESNCVFLDNPRFLSSISNSVCMVLTNSKTAERMENNHYGICIVDKPRELFFQIHNFLSNDASYSRPIYKTEIGKNCFISNLTEIADNNVTIGDNVIIEEFVSIRENTIIGDNTIIRSGAKIGGVGFEYKRVSNGVMSVSHIGGVVIGNNVEIQYNTCVDRGIYPWDNTVIGDYCKIDNLVHIAHGVKLGKSTMIAANSGIAGRTILGDDCWVGFASTIINGITIGNEAHVDIGSVVLKSIPTGKTVLGNPAVGIEKYAKIQYELNELINKK